MRYTIGVLCAAAIVAAPATASAPTLTALAHREHQDYKRLDRRVRALTALLVNQRLRTRIVFDNLERNGNFWTGAAACVKGEITGGGVDWGSNEGVRGDWVVNYSHPYVDGSVWQVQLFNGSQQAPALIPRVYVVCATV